MDEIDRRAIDTEMKFMVAHTPSVFSSVSICYSIRCCPLISILGFDDVTYMVYTFRGAVSLFVINKINGNTKSSAITIQFIIWAYIISGNYSRYVETSRT